MGVKNIDGLMESATNFMINAKAVVSHFSRFFISLLLIAFAGVITFPMLFVLNLALKTSQAYFREPASIASGLQFQNFVEAWTLGGFQHYMLNSALVVLMSLAILFVVTALATYALVEFDLPAKGLVLLVIIAGFMVPPEVLLVPLFTIINELGWINQYQSVIVTYVGFSIPFSVFLLRQFFTTLPDSFAEAARMDGCSELEILSYVYLPLSIPAIATILVYQFVLLWNEFLYAIIFLPQDSMRTTPAGIMALRGGYYQDPPVLAAGVLIAALPTILVFLVFRNYFIKGFMPSQL